jgi:hypothetical protein
VSDWTPADVEAVLDHITDELYDKWNLAGVGQGTDPDGTERGEVWIEKGATPHTGLLVWIASLEHPDMIRIREDLMSLPGEGPWYDYQTGEKIAPSYEELHGT